LDGSKEKKNERGGMGGGESTWKKESRERERRGGGGERENELSEVQTFELMVDGDGLKMGWMREKGTKERKEKYATEPCVSCRDAMP